MITAREVIVLNSWEEYVFLGLFLSCFALAFLTRDDRIHVGTITLLGSWVASMLMKHYVPMVPYIVGEVGINLTVLYIFMQLHFKREGEEREPYWPLAVMALEALIFCSHLAYWFYGFQQYAFTVNVFFGLELVVVIAIAAIRVMERFFLTTTSRL